MSLLKSVISKATRKEAPTSGHLGDAQFVGFDNPDALKDLSGRLLRSLASASDNSVISPSCLYQTLALASELTSGDTRDQLVELLGGEETVASTVSATSDIDVPKYGRMDFHYSTGVSVWADKSVSLGNGNAFRTGSPVACLLEQVNMGSTAAPEKMGAWLAENTGGLYSQTPAVDPETLLVLIGAMYLKDSWECEFEGDKPRVFVKDDGVEETADFMLGWSHYDLLEENGSITLPKKLSSGCETYMSLPPEGKTLNEYVESGEAWQNICANANGECTESRRECKVYMPKFDLSSEGIDLTGFLQDIGVTQMFELDADFSPLSSDDRWTA